MSDASRRMGRPPDPETLTRARHFLELTSKYGVPVRTIAEREGLTASRIWDLLKTAREQLAAERGPEDPAEVPGQARPTAAPRKMSQAALLRRAWLATHTDGRLRIVGRAMRSFWTDVVATIHAAGDGNCLLFAEAGYKGHADFATALEGSEDDLAVLLERRLLVDIEGSGFGLPANMGLMRGEGLGGPMPARRSRPDRRQTHMLQVLTGGLEDSSEVTQNPGQALPASTGLAYEMKALIKPGRVPNAGEIGRVQGWLEAGDSAAAIRAVIEARLKGGGHPVTLHYFDDAMREARKARQRPPAAAASPVPPLSEADQALRALLKPPGDAWVKDRSCPFPPDPGSFKSAVDAGNQWLEVWHAWDQSGRPDRLKPPDFTALAQQRAIYDARMREIEEALTTPEDTG